jgi:rSAM/selenodomain-associated transferase 1
MAKPPVVGAAKTRLAAEVGAPAAARLAAAMLRDTLALAAAGAPESELVLAYAGDPGRYGEAVPAGWRLVPQGEGSLGDRLERLLGPLAEPAARPTVVLGSDSPQLPAARLGEAFAALATHDLALGPCADGGYYLLGTRRGLPVGLLREVRWGSSHAGEDTRAAGRRAGLTCALLPPGYDLDRLGDLRRLAGELAGRPEGELANLRAALRELGLSRPGR